MLTVTIPSIELFDDVKQEFITSKTCTLQLEHSLVSLSKWESKWNKAFLSKEDKTIDETIDYIRCMTVTQNVDPFIYSLINNEIIKQVTEYIEAPMTATTIIMDKKTFGRDIITAEIIYYNMITMNIPFECQKWHLNRLLTLIQVCGVKNKTAKPMSRKEIMNRNQALNASRRQMMNSKG